MSALRGLRGPADLRTLRPSELTGLAAEIRDFLVRSVARRGGHLGSNLGAVELTIALHRVFDSPADPILFDTGHQAYPHKLLTGRIDGFESLRARDGVSGYPNADESPHDVIANSHASTALAYADGMAKAFELAGRDDRTVVAVVGDGSLTGGLAWEALNNLGASRRHVVVVLNDNGRSYSPTVGAIAGRLRRLRNEPAGYPDLVDLLGSSGLAEPAPPDGTPAAAARGSANFFAQLGLHYLGPVDGHDLAALETAFAHARDRTRTHGPVVVHCVTRKGRGYPPAEQDDIDHLHSTGAYDPATGPAAAPSAATWTDVFAAEMCAIARDREDVVGVTAAMLHPTGLAPFAAAYPDRVYDVGIAEQYATTSAAGLALGGRHPVVAVYSTFLNRAFDQTMFDVALHGQPVTFVIDRAGITGPDGPSHHGMWDLAILRSVPGMRVAAPRDAERLSEELREAVAVADGPTALRFPKATAGEELPAVYRTGDVDVLHVPDREDVLLVAVGAMAKAALEAARQLAADGVGCTVVDPRWPLPVAAEVTRLAGRHGVVVTVEDGVRQGGVGEAVRQAVVDADARTPVHVLGLPTAFVPHGSRAELLAEAGLDVGGIVAGVHDAVRRYGSSGTAAVPDKIDTENFPVALRVLPADVRADLVAIYRFARYVDDVGDESAGDRHRGLDAVDADLDVLFTGGRPTLPAVSGLRTFVDRCATPDGPFRRLVQANRQDQVVSRYATFDQLRDYCRLSADPVGELVLHVFGRATPDRVALSDRICTALQVIEHLQDVREDYERGRIYLPKDDMDRFGVVESALGASAATFGVRRLVAFEARRAGRLLDDGTPLLRTLHGWARVCVTGYVAGGRAALAALRRAGYDPLPGAPKAGRVDLLRAAVRVATASAPVVGG